MKVKRIISVFAVLFMLVCASALVSCGGTGREPAENVVERSPATETVFATEPESGTQTGTETEFAGETIRVLFDDEKTFDLTVTKSGSRLRYVDVYQAFQPLYGYGHSGYLQHVDLLIGEMREKIVGLREELVTMITDRYQKVIEVGPNMTYDEYYSYCVTPFVEYFDAQLAEAENAQKAYYGVVFSRSGGGNSISDASLLFRYVRYCNIYDELYDLYLFYGGEPK